MDAAEIRHSSAYLLGVAEERARWLGLLVSAIVAIGAGTVAYIFAAWILNNLGG